MSRFLLVELEWDLAHSRYGGTTHDAVVLTIGATNGVRAVTDLEAISRDTLDLMLLPPQQSYRTISKKKRG